MQADGSGSTATANAAEKSTFLSSQRALITLCLAPTCTATNQPPCESIATHCNTLQGAKSPRDGGGEGEPDGICWYLAQVNTDANTKSCMCMCVTIFVTDWFLFLNISALRFCRSHQFALSVTFQVRLITPTFLNIIFIHSIIILQPAK